MDKFVGIIGKIGPAFSEGRSRSGEILSPSPEVTLCGLCPSPVLTSRPIARSSYAPLSITCSRVSDTQP